MGKPGVVYPPRVRVAIYKCEECGLKRFQPYEGSCGQACCGNDQCFGDMYLWDGPADYFLIHGWRARIRTWWLNFLCAHLERKFNRMVKKERRKLKTEAG